MLSSTLSKLGALQPEPPAAKPGTGALFLALLCWDVSELPPARGRTASLPVLWMVMKSDVCSQAQTWPAGCQPAAERPPAQRGALPREMTGMHYCSIS